MGGMQNRDPGFDSRSRRQQIEIKMAPGVRFLGPVAGAWRHRWRQRDPGSRGANHGGDTWGQHLHRSPALEALAHECGSPVA